MSEVQEFLQKYGYVLPKAIRWLDITLEYYRLQAKPLNDFGFDRIPRYFSKEILGISKVVVVDRIPNMPLYSQGGITELKAFEGNDYQVEDVISSRIDKIISDLKLDP